MTLNYIFLSCFILCCTILSVREYENVLFCPVLSALQNELRKKKTSPPFHWSLNTFLMINSTCQQKVVISKASFSHELDNENISVMLSFLWAFQWYHFHSNKTWRMKRTKTVPELFAAGDFICDTVFSESTDNYWFAL